MPASLPPGIRLARVVGLLGSGILFGTYYSSSVHTVPALQATLQSGSPPSSILSTFTTLQAKSHSFLLWTIAGTASSFSLVAYHLFTRPGLLADVGEWGWFAGAAGMVAFVIPYSKVCMKGANRELRCEAEKAGVKGLGGAEVANTEVVKRDLDAWKRGNMFRALSCLIAGGLAGWAGGREIDVV